MTRVREAGEKERTVETVRQQERENRGERKERETERESE